MKSKEKLKLMRKKISLLLFGILACFVLLMSAQKTPPVKTIQELIDESIAQKLQRYKDVRTRKCTEKILEEAGNRADSIIIAAAKGLRVLQDTITRPIAPDRPDRPELMTPIDSSAPAPLLNEEVLDSLK